MKMSEIEQRLNERRREIEARIKRWDEISHHFVPVVEALRDLEPANFEFDSDLNISISGDKHLLARCVRALRTNGFGHNAPPPVAGQTQWMAFFYKNIPNDEVVRVWFVFTSTVCRRVPKGTKMVEVTEYETICDSLAIEEETELGGLIGTEAEVPQVEWKVPF